MAQNKRIQETKTYLHNRHISLLWWKELVFASQRALVTRYIHPDVNVKLISGVQIHRIWNNEVGYQQLRKK